MSRFYDHDEMVIVMKALSYLVDHIDSVMSVEHWAELCGVPRHKFWRLFRKYFNSSPQKFLNLMRSSRVQELLNDDPNLFACEVAPHVCLGSGEAVNYLVRVTQNTNFKALKENIRLNPISKVFVAAPPDGWYPDDPEEVRWLKRFANFMRPKNNKLNG